jgi:uroporphyrinogen-III synthase
VRLLIIRPQPGADATAKRVRAAGHEAITIPLFEVQPVDWNAPSTGEFDALLLTSGNAVRQAGPGLAALSDLPVLAVGSASARAAEHAGLTVAITGESGVVEVIALAQTAGQRNLLWLAGEDRIEVPLPEGLTLETRIVYRSAALPPPENFSVDVNAADAVLLHSPRAARHFAGLCDSQAIDRACISLAALSPAIAKNAGEGWKSVVVAPIPNDVMLLAQL